MTDIVQRLRSFKENVSNDMIELLETPEVCTEAADEIERLRIRCDGYQASRDWAITTLAGALHVETDTVRALEYYARLAAEKIERLRADSVRLDWLLRNVSGKEFRRLGIEYEAGCSRHNIDVALGENNEPVHNKPAGE